VTTQTSPKFAKLTKDSSYSDTAAGLVVIPQGTVVEIDRMRPDGSILFYYQGGELPFEISSAAGYEPFTPELYTRWGNPVEIVQNHGEVELKGYGRQVLLTCKGKDDGKMRAYFASSLRCTNGGICEIDVAVGAAPVQLLTQVSKKAKIKEAM
jgi:hypothetical protein